MSASDVENQNQQDDSDNTDRIQLHPEAGAGPADDQHGDGEDEDQAVPELFGTETMAELHARQGQLGQAIAIFQRLIERDPQAERRAHWQERCRSLERARAHTGDLEILSESKAPPPLPPKRAEPPEPEVVPVHRLPLIVSQPVRSGQVVYARGSDLIVLGPVNPGGQVVADGHIHVYGTLRGRAVAGAQGCAEARIFCQRLEAELLAINGIYLVFDDLPSGCVGKPAQVEVQDGQCVVKVM